MDGVNIGIRGDTRSRRADRAIASIADAIDAVIDLSRLKIGKVLTRIQNRLRRTSIERRPDDAEMMEHHRKMMMFDGDFSTPPAAAELIEKMRQSTNA